MRFFHPFAGLVSIAVIALFLSASAVAELSGDAQSVRSVKTAIPWGLFVLIPALVAAGGSGTLLGRGRVGRRLEAKRMRMRLIAANGLLVLTPAAVFLADRAAHLAFDNAFYAVQAAEFIAGAANLVWLGLNMRDGFAMRTSPRP